MMLPKTLKRQWFTKAIYIGFSAFFLVAGVISAGTYSHVLSAQKEIKLVNASYDASVLENGSVWIRFEISLLNPSRYDLHLSTSTWSTMILNRTTGSNRIIPIETVYTGPTAYITLPAEDTHLFSYETTISSRDTLSDLLGYINYSASTGHDYALDSLPYYHEFAISAWMGGFEHEYLRESYLNDIVSVDLRYSSAQEEGT